MTPLDKQLDWLLRQIKDFVLSHYSGRISIDCKQGSIMQIEKEPSVLLSVNKISQADVLNFCTTANIGDSITFTYRPDDKVGKKEKIVLKAPHG